MRRKYENGSLTPKQIEALNEIGFEWRNVNRPRGFEERFKQLELFKKKYGNCNTNSRSPEMDNLGQWVQYMRKRKVAGELGENEVALLEGIGLVWNPLEQKEEESIRRIIDITKRKSLGEKVTFDAATSRVCYRLRQSYEKDELNEVTAKRLIDAGFVMDPNAEVWSKRVTQLKDYYSKHNTCNIVGGQEIGKLRDWLNRQVRIYKKGSYSEKKYKELLDIGFDLKKLCNN